MDEQNKDTKHEDESYCLNCDRWIGAFDWDTEKDSCIECADNGEA